VVEERKHWDITSRIIGCAMNVHTTMGNGFQEAIYQRCLAVELEHEGIPFAREQDMPVTYRGREVGSRRVDFVVEDKVIVELKAIAALEDVHLAQGLNYLEAYGFEIGLLLNFGAPRLEYKRLIRDKRPRT